MSVTDYLRLPRRFGKATIWGRAPLNLTIVVLLHLAALTCLVLTEAGPLGQLLFLLAWGLLNFAWLILLRRPVISAALSLAIFVIVILMSQFKFDITWMTITFLDVLIIDADTFAFLLKIFPDLRTSLLVTAAVAIPVAILLWCYDRYRVRLRTSRLSRSMGLFVRRQRQCSRGKV